MTADLGTRGRERVRRVGLTGIATLASQGVKIATGLVSIPMTARYLGPERFGLWLLLGSFLSWVSLVDLGLSNTLTTELARADGREDSASPPILVSSAVFPVLVIAASILLVFSMLYPWANWAHLLNSTSAAASGEVGPALAVTAIIFSVRLPLGIIGRIYSAYQEGHRYQLWSGVGSTVAVAGLIGALVTHATLPVLLATFYGLGLVGDVFAAAETFALRRPWLIPRLRNFDLRVARSLLATGLMFWIAQVAVVLLLETDLLVVTRMFGVAAVAEYGVALRLYGLVSLVQMAFASSLWPAYAEALARRDLLWVKAIFTRSVVLGAAWAVLASAVILLLGNWAVRLLIGGETSPGIGLLAAMASTAILTAVAQSLAMLLNGLGEIRIQAWFGMGTGLLNVAVSVVLAKVLGLPGVALGTTVAVVPNLAISAWFLRRRVQVLKFEALSS